MQLSSISLAITRLGQVWTPAQLFSAGEQGVWYDPSDFSTLFQDSAGTTPVTAVEQPVGKILDKSGRGNHATQATAASRPILKIDGNGRYWLFDGVDDSMATGSIDFTATDKMTVFAGVRKLSDAAIGILCELSADSNTNNGSLFVAAPITVSGSNYSILSKGTIATSAAATGLAAPITNVVAGAFNISAPNLVTRVNGTQRNLSAATQGTGNYGNYPLYIGRRGGTTLPFNGNLYSLIVRGAQSSAAQITSAETYVNGKTAAY